MTMTRILATASYISLVFNARVLCFSVGIQGNQHVSRRLTNQRSGSFLLMDKNGSQCPKNDDSNEPDLFEYFDPLLSPHAYPNGISPNNKPVDLSREKAPPLERYDPFKLEYLKGDKKQKSRPPVDTSEVFDPTISPHEYANGTPDKIVGGKGTRSDSKNNASPYNNSKQRGDRPMVDTSVVFDPTISPHEYSNGTPDVVVGDTGTVYVDDSVGKKNPRQKLVGILLMDHGSRNEAANQRLIELAKLYEATFSGNNVIVRGAHMEIASPSIPEQLESLIDAGVDEIICHPYFLSPGRHVQEDIPSIVKQAINDLKIDIPIVTTEPIGAETDMMLQAVNKAVRASSLYLDDAK